MKIMNNMSSNLNNKELNNNSNIIENILYKQDNNHAHMNQINNSKVSNNNPIQNLSYNQPSIKPQPNSDLSFSFKLLDLSIVDNAKFDFDLKHMIEMFEVAKFDIEDLSFKVVNKMHANLKEVIKKQAKNYITENNL